MTYIDEARAIGPRPVWQIVPPQDYRDRMAQEGAPATPPGGYPLKDHGGSTIKSPKLVLVYLGAWWGDTARLEQFAKELMAYGYLAPLSAYGSGQGSYVGSFQGPAVSGVVTDMQLQAELADMIMGHPQPIPNFPQPDANTLYALLLPESVTVEQGTSASCSAFCGYHEAYTLADGRTFYYTVQPSTTCQGCNQGDAFAAFTMVLGHEVAEACTDAIPGQGWFNDQTGMENADEWAWRPKPYGPWTVQGYQVNGVGNDFGAYTPPAGPGPQPPLVVTIGPLAQPVAGQAVGFGITVSPQVGADAVYAWDFGDGSTSAVPSASHMYSRAGTFTVKCTVTSGAASGTGTVIVSVQAAQPKPETCRPAVDTEFGQLNTIVAAAASASATDPRSSAWYLGGLVWLGWARQNIDAALQAAQATVSLEEALGADLERGGSDGDLADEPASFDRHAVPLPPDLGA